MTITAFRSFARSLGLPLLGLFVFFLTLHAGQIAKVKVQGPAEIQPRPVRFAVIGDFGLAGQPEADVAALVQSWNPSFVITTGDNNYPFGAAATIDQNIGQYYQQFIYPYLGTYGSGASVNRFFPSLGNHDWYATGAQPYLDYFELPGNERYYDVRQGPVHLFALDSDPNEPDGVSAASAQGQWLQAGLSASKAPFKLVYLHHAPYSSGQHGPSAWMQWPFADWGADAVLAGHDHTYERLEVGRLPYFVNGLGGKSIYPFLVTLPGSKVRYNNDYGAMLVATDSSAAKFQFVTRAGNVVDTITIPPVPPGPDEAVLVPAGSVWRYLDDGSDPGPSWAALSFDDSAWASGPAQLGYGDGDETTVVSYGPDPANKHITTYFRRSFTVASAAAYGGVRLRVLRDDGVRVSLNGKEAYRADLPFGAVGVSTLAPEAVTGAEESTFWETQVDPGLLRDGTNVLAVEIHQSSPASTDISLDLELAGLY